MRGKNYDVFAFLQCRNNLKGCLQENFSPPVRIKFQDLLLSELILQFFGYNFGFYRLPVKKGFALSKMSKHTDLDLHEEILLTTYIIFSVKYFSRNFSSSKVPKTYSSTQTKMQLSPASRRSNETGHSDS